MWRSSLVELTIEQSAILAALAYQTRNVPKGVVVVKGKIEDGLHPKSGLKPQENLAVKNTLVAGLVGIRMERL
jgi:hypothetical protein